MLGKAKNVAIAVAFSQLQNLVFLKPRYTEILYIIIRVVLKL